MSVVRCVVMGSRDFTDEDYIRSAMLRVWSDITDRGSNASRVQFVFPSEVGYDRIERPVKGVARTAFAVLHNARQQGRTHKSMLMPMLVPVDWNRVEYRDQHHHHFHHEVLDSRKVAPTDIWNRDVLDAGIWSEYILSQSSSAEPEFLVAPSHVVTIEFNGPYGWCQSMQSYAAKQNVSVHEFKTRDFAIGLRK